MSQKTAVAAFCAALGSRYPIIQAPMAGGPSTTAMTTAAIKAGCIGSIAATGLTPSALRTAIRTVYAECGGPQVPLIVNVQLPPLATTTQSAVPLWSEPQWATRLNNALLTEAALTATVNDVLQGKCDTFLSTSIPSAEIQQHLEALVLQHRNSEMVENAGMASLEWESLRKQVADSYMEWVKMTEGVIEVVLEEKPKAFSWVFGTSPGEEILRKLRGEGILLVGAATTLQEYTDSVNSIAELDAIVLQGNEAGGHRASHGAPYWNSLTSRSNENWKSAEMLLREVSGARRASSGQPPFLLSAGGLMTPNQLVERLAMNDESGQPIVGGVLLGTALLAATDAGTSQVHRAALGAPQFFGRVSATDSFSGRWAQGLHSFNFSLFDKTTPILFAETDGAQGRFDVLPFPFQNILTAKRRKAIGAVRGSGNNAVEADALSSSVEIRRMLAAAHFTSCWCGSGWNVLQDPFYQQSTSAILRRFTEAIDSAGNQQH